MVTAMQQLIDKLPPEFSQIKIEAEHLLREEKTQLEMAYVQGFKNGVLQKFDPFEIYHKKTYNDSYRFPSEQD